MWRVEGYDILKRNYYPFDGEFPDEEGARQAAHNRLQQVKKFVVHSTQRPRREHDKIFLINPAGERLEYKAGG